MDDARQQDSEPELTWCPGCGIPHGAGITHCSHCGRPLVEGGAVAAGAAPSVPVGPGDPVEAAGPAQVLAPAPPMPGAAPGAPAGVLARAMRRPLPASDAEIEAAAAAIVARAKALEAEGPTPPPADAALPAAFVPSEEWASARADQLVTPLSVAPAMRSRDRAWLIAGIALFVVVIILMVFFARGLAGVMR
jgi:hypothetical protein